jgi:hypothetical protein
MNVHKRARRPRSAAACAEASIPASEMTDADEELAVFCHEGGDSHSLPHRHHATLKRLRGAPDFAGIVITDGGKIRCPRCGQKLDWRPTPTMGTVSPLRVMR